jgi:signal transduction histidine kinase/ActR/RegA family two-component response regulator
MSTDPQVIRSEAHTEIGEILQRDLAIVLERWGRHAIEEQPDAKRVHHAVLLDHLHDLLKKLALSLAESDDPHTCRHCLPAILHGEQRWEAGWSLAEVVRDYQILRVVLFDFLEEALDRPIGYREVLAIGLAIDEAITLSVVSFTNGRDEYLRQLEEQRAEEARQTKLHLQEQAQALQDADRRKNDFLAILSHELRNPLAPIRNAVQIWRIKGSADPELKLTGEIIERQVQQMTRLVDDLLDVSRITRDKIILHKEPIALNAIVDCTLESVRPIIEARRHLLRVSLPPEPIWLEADAARLVQVFQNLLINAAKYTDEGGKILLTAARQNNQIIIKITDTGIGISPDLLPQVFDPFIQGQRSKDRAQGGLGLGLTVVRNIVESHGGTVQAFSAGRGEGSEFVLHLPVLDEPVPSPSEAKKTKSLPSVTGLRILVVDDHVDSASSLALLLRLAGHDARTAHDGPAALEAVQTYAPNIVLLDLGLPNMDGLEVARRIRTEMGLKDLLLVAITGYGKDEDRHQSKAAGCDVHLVKPVDIDKLHALLARPNLARHSEIASD